MQRVEVHQNYVFVLVRRFAYLSQQHSRLPLSAES